MISILEVNIPFYMNLLVVMVFLIKGYHLTLSLNNKLPNQIKHGKSS